MRREEMATMPFVPKIITKEPVEEGDSIIYNCSSCWSPINMFDLEDPKNLLATFTVGINPEVRWSTKNPSRRQYREFEEEFFIFEVFKLCHWCTPSMVERLYLIVTECTGFSREYLLARPDMPDLVVGLGHHLTLIEYIPGVLGNYFNIQVDKKTYREIIVKLPRNMIQFHLNGYHGW